ncbi:MAG: hypothetical protein WD556_09365 [Actinomycetota bacterium]
MKTWLIMLGSAAIASVVIGVASAGSNGTEAGVPEGPYVDFCPTTEQIEAHLEKYGFDYKPTVPCGEGGQELATDGNTVEPEEEAEEKAFLESARRAPDTDGDPATMEIKLPDGEEGVIYINTDNPERYKDMTPAEFAEEVYP